MQSSKRRPYVKPTISKVSLVPDEAVLGGCKSDVGQPASGNAGGCVVPMSCLINWS